MPRKKSVETPIVKVCPECKGTFIPTNKKLSARKRRKFCSQRCASVFNSRLGAAKIKELFKDPNYRDTLEWAYQEFAVRMTENNPMKRSEVVAKQSASRKQMFREHPEMKEHLSSVIRQKWADGKLDGVAVGKCKWYTHTRSDGTVVKLQGTWEVATARCFDELDIEYVAHRGRITYTDEQGLKRSYYPDFYIAKWNVYVDVKGAFWNKEQEGKIGLIRKSNPDLYLIVATKPILKAWGVKLAETQRELLKAA